MANNIPDGPLNRDYTLPLSRSVFIGKYPCPPGGEFRPMSLWVYKKMKNGTEKKKKM
jgi:hypothetical protein